MSMKGCRPQMPVEGPLQLSCALAQLKYQIMALTWLFLWSSGGKSGWGRLLLGTEGSPQDHSTVGPEGFYF